jgi:catechol 2,3-dioxygenase-like lactoylglutathione lyase family enzyme
MTGLVKKVHHVAYRCKDAKQTVEWYGRHLGMKFILAIAEDAVPSTGEADPYMHVFLDAGGGNVLAFFELPTRPEMGRDPNTPAWTQHLALEVGSMEELLAAKARLEADGIEGGRPRPTMRCSSRSTSSIRAATGWNWPATPTRRK